MTRFLSDILLPFPSSNDLNSRVAIVLYQLLYIYVSSLQFNFYQVLLFLHCHLVVLQTYALSQISCTKNVELLDILCIFQYYVFIFWLEIGSFLLLKIENIFLNLLTYLVKKFFGRPAAAPIIHLTTKQKTEQFKPQYTFFKFSTAKTLHFVI